MSDPLFDCLRFYPSSIRKSSTPFSQESLCTFHYENSEKYHHTLYKFQCIHPQTHHIEWIDHIYESLCIHIIKTDITPDKLVINPRIHFINKTAKDHFKQKFFDWLSLFEHLEKEWLDVSNKKRIETFTFTYASLPFLTIILKPTDTNSGLENMFEDDWLLDADGNITLNSPRNDSQAQYSVPPKDEWDVYLDVYDYYQKGQNRLRKMKLPSLFSMGMKSCIEGFRSISNYVRFYRHSYTRSEIILGSYIALSLGKVSFQYFRRMIRFFLIGFVP